MSARTPRFTALEILDRMEQIVEAEQIVHGCYIADDTPPQRGHRALCGGRQACAVGSLYLAAGRRPKADAWGDPYLPGVEPKERDAVMGRNPELRRAYDALNAAARRYTRRHGLLPYCPENDDGTYEGDMEFLFEEAIVEKDDDDPAREGRKILRSIIKSARRSIAADSGAGS